MTKHVIDSFYDRSIRLWTCLWIDAHGNQVGAAQYAANRKAKNDLVTRMAKTKPADYQVG